MAPDYIEGLAQPRAKRTHRKTAAAAKITPASKSAAATALPLLSRSSGSSRRHGRSGDNEGVMTALSCVGIGSPSLAVGLLVFAGVLLGWVIPGDHRARAGPERRSSPE